MALSKEYIRRNRNRPGGSNIGRKKLSSGKPRKDFVGTSGGAPKGSYPIPDVAHGRSALRLAGHAPNPAGIRAAVYRKYPQLRKKKQFGGEITDSTNARSEATKRLAESIEKSTKQQKASKLASLLSNISFDDKLFSGKTNETDEPRLIKGGKMANRAITGASIGTSIAPGVGTAIGGGIGLLEGLGEEIIEGSQEQKEWREAKEKEKERKRKEMLQDALNRQEETSFKKGGTISASKAHKILSDGTIRGKKLTTKQKKYFGWILGKKRNQRAVA